MGWKRIVLTAFIIIILFIGLGVILFLSGIFTGSEQGNGTAESKFSIVEMSNAGDYGYIVYDYAGAGNLTLISYRKDATKDITVIRDDEGIEMEKFEEFVQLLKPLEKYGYTIQVSNKRVLGKGIYIVPTGAMPTYILDDITTNATSGVVIYLGKKNFVLHGGMQERDWYTQLTPTQRDRVLLYDKTLREYMEAGNYTIVKDILENRWASNEKAVYSITGEGRKTAKIKMEDGRYVRAIYDLSTRKGITDSVALAPISNILVPDPQNKYPSQDSELLIRLNETDGIAYFTVLKDGREVKSEKLRSAGNGSVFREILEFDEPGDYILRVVDNSGSIASGVLHVNEIKIENAGRSGYNNYFYVTVDGVPLKSAEIEANMENSTIKKKFFVSNGDLTIPAQLKSGKNVFVMNIDNEKIRVPVLYEEQNMLDVYMKYGIPGMILVVIVYAGARLSRRPTYILKATEGSRDIRSEVRVSADDLVEAFKKIRADIKIGKNPLTTHEFEIAIKRYLTNGADVTEGNVEEILKRLVSRGMLESHRQYYQFTGEGNVKENTLLRMIREKLIENGISFKAVGKKFVTKDFDIGLFDEKFKGKAIVVVDDEDDIKKIMGDLSADEKAKVRIKEANGMLTFVTIDQLGEII